MSPLLLALLGVLVVPLFVGSWRASLLGLAAQGLLMAGIAHRAELPLRPVEGWITFVDLALIRGVFTPLALYAVLRRQSVPARNDVIPPNLFFWTLALGLGLVAFNFSERLVAEPGPAQTLVALAIAGVLLGFLVLSGASGPFSQMVGALRIENSIVLLELSSGDHPATGLRLAMLAAFVTTMGFFCWYLSTLAQDSEVARASAADSPTL